MTGSPVTEEAVRGFLLSRLAGQLHAAGLELDSVPDDLDLLGSSIIDSFGFLELIGDVENHFGFAVDFEEIDAVDLTAVGPFSRFVASSQAGPGLQSEPNGRPQAPPEPEPEPVVARPQPALASAAPRRTPGPLRRPLGAVAVGLYRFCSRVWAKLFSLSVSGSFASFGSSSVIQPPVRLVGERRIALGSGVYVGAGSWLQTLPGADDSVAISIGDRASFAGMCVLSAVSSIRIGDDVSVARGVYVADHAHAYDQVGVPIQYQGVTGIAPIEIADGAWLGENAVVLPGVRIGRGAVVSANSVVTRDVPDDAVVAGSPARVIRRLGDREEDSPIG